LARAFPCVGMASTGVMAEGFGELFSAIAASGAAACELRWLRKCAVEAAAAEIVRLGRQPATQQAAAACGEDTFRGLDLALAAVADKAGMQLTPTVTAAKAWLRQSGESGHMLASRLSRVSKRRNGTAHPDAALARDIGALKFDVVVEAQPDDTNSTIISEVSGFGTSEPEA